ncbi:rho guanine nucleotide exchange factor 12 [Kryptolebias marmoratus]|uniref:Rho guanine nucleotide exchange factor 12-like n=1 Tax=Kryptolebias marmoratus TaxID=37003 RepID=A0A3Q3AL73_KRYMA|nr:rho guanine nucleotide exchange factor 12 [Kryptolebias marmoratus]
MSGTQPTLTDRTPMILNKDVVDRKPKNGKSSVSLKHEFDPTGLVQRCVIIQRDENGFGLTVSGNNPVFVQLVKEDGAAMRAGVQTGDRIIKVNGRLVTHSNHKEVVELIKSGSYVALTVLGRPPGLPQIPLDEEKEEQQPQQQEEEEEEEEADSPPFISAPNSPVLSGEERSSFLSSSSSSSKPCSPHNHVSCCPPDGDAASGSRNAEDEEGDGASSLKEQNSPAGSEGRFSISSNNNATNSSHFPESSGINRRSPGLSRRDDPVFCSSPDAEDTPDADSSAQLVVATPSYTLNLQIIGAEDDYFDSQQEQINNECSSFQSINVLKSRPAHLAVFLHHVVSQFDPAPLLCFLYADIHKQTSSKESRRFFIEFHSLFLDRTANLKVPMPEAVAAELEKRRLELLPEELCKQYSQALQDSLLSDLHKNLEDFRQKRSMGLTLAEDELSKLDSERDKDQQASEKECSCAEHVLSKIEDILLSSHPSEEEKCQNMQYVIHTYMKHLGVKVKEPRGLEQKRARMNFLPKIKVKSAKPEKEGEEKVKKPRFPNILGPPRRLSRVDSTSVGKAVEQNKQRSPKFSPLSIGIPELLDSSASSSGRNHPSEASDSGGQSASSAASPGPSSLSPTSDTSGQETDTSVSPFSVQPRLSDVLQPVDHQDGLSSPTCTHFDFGPSNLDQRDEDQDAFRMEVQSTVSSADIQSEDDQAEAADGEEDPLNWQKLVSRGVLESLTPKEIKRQEVINELFYTERAHLRMLRVLDGVFCQRLTRDGILPPEDIKHIFINLEEILQLHVSITEQMAAIRRRSETSVIGQIGDDLLAWFSEEEEEKMKKAVGTFCSNQPSALELIKTRQKKDQRFNLFMQEARSNRLCRRLQLKDIIPVEMQRVTKYPLLLDSIAKNTENGEEREKVKKAGECCKKILNHVNQAVKEAENKQRLENYQRRLDVSSLKQSENPVILELRNLDLTKRKMVHEGPLSWKVNKDKTIELYTVLLEDIMVLLQKQDERLVLKFHGKNLVSAADTKHIFSPVIKLNTVLVRPVATDKKAFFVLSMSENGVQMYELMAQTVSDRRTWQCLITQRADAMKAKPHGAAAPPAQPEAERNAAGIGNDEASKRSAEPSETSRESVGSSDKDAPSSPGDQPPPNPFDGLKSEDEEEELAVADRPEEEEEEGVDEAELEAFLDDQLAVQLLQDGSSPGAADEHDHVEFNSSSKAEEALRTLAMLKHAIFTHMASREAEEELEETKRSAAPEGPSAASGDIRPPEGQPTGKDNPQLPSVPTGDTETTEQNGGFVVLDFEAGSEESGAGVVVGADVRIDMRKLLSSSSQAGSGGPVLSRQLMTHLRLLQADLQYLKDVETKYNELRRIRSNTAAAADPDDNAGAFRIAPSPEFHAD